MARTAKSKKHIKSRKRFDLGSYLTMDRIIIGGVIVFVIGFIVVVFINGAASQPPNIDLSAVDDNSQLFTSQGTQHIDTGEAHPAYNSNPPTSGWHYGQDVDLGVYTDPLADEQVVHNLEHGHVWLSYRDADDQEALNLLSDIQRRYSDQVIVTYRPQNDSRVAAVAWTRLLTVDELDADELSAFIVRYRNRAPENIPG